mmetsp:Transcript_15767/g.49378  ORF Transcript_15767/g.49378 Transcript_15767/m.49378 type:complete len:450 (-) Transcript_15767:19-1368(-)
MPGFGAPKFKWTAGPKASGKMKGFMWTKIKNVDKTIFKDLSEKELRDFAFSWDEVESTFAIKKVKAKDLSAKAGADDGSALVNLIDGKTSQNLQVWLSQYKDVPMSKIVSALLKLDEKAFQAAQIKTLIATLPGKDNTHAVNDYLKDGGDKARLGNAEVFTIELQRVPSVELYLEAFLFYLDFESAKADIRPSIVSVRNASRQVFASKRWTKLIQLILHLGNFINGNSIRGDTPGFQLSSVLKLQDTKSTDNKMSLLDYLVRTVKEKEPDLLAWPEDMKDLHDASRVSTSQLQADVGTLRKGVRTVKDALAAVGADAQHFTLKMETFVARAENAIEKIQADMDKMAKGYDKLAAFFGCDPAKMPADEFFGTVYKFATSFEMTVKNLTLAEERAKTAARREDAKAAKLAEYRQKKAALAEKGEEVSAFDSMLNSIAVGDAFVHSRGGKDE